MSHYPFLLFKTSMKVIGSLFLKPQFNEDMTSDDVLHNRLVRVIKRNFYATNPNLRFPSKPVVFTGIKDNLADFTTLMCIYRSSSSYSESSITCIMKEFSQQMSEHLSVSGLGKVKQTSSSIWLVDMKLQIYLITCVNTRWTMRNRRFFLVVNNREK